MLITSTSDLPFTNAHVPFSFPAVFLDEHSEFAVSGCCLFLLLEHNHGVLLDEKQQICFKFVVVGSFLHCDL